MLNILFNFYTQALREEERKYEEKDRTEIQQYKKRIELERRQSIQYRNEMAKQQRLQQEAEEVLQQKLVENEAAIQIATLQDVREYIQVSSPALT